MKLKEVEMVLLRGLFAKITPQPAYAFAMCEEKHDVCYYASCEGNCDGCPGSCKGDCKGGCKDDCQGCKGSCTSMFG